MMLSVTAGGPPQAWPKSYALPPTSWRGRGKTDMKDLALSIALHILLPSSGTDSPALASMYI